jgi:nucleotide-binding universal stress UspA family protein
MRRILLAYDGSEGAKRALEVALSLPRAEDGVTVVAVAEGVPLLGYGGTLPSPEQERERDAQLEDAVSAFAARGIGATAIARSGDPATAILDVAAEEGVDLIVLGTRGLSTAERWLVGSVSTKVLHHARCSVLVAR